MSKIVLCAYITMLLTAESQIVNSLTWLHLRSQCIVDTCTKEVHPRSHRQKSGCWPWFAMYFIKLKYMGLNHTMNTITCYLVLETNERADAANGKDAR